MTEAARTHHWIKLRWYNLLRSPRVLGFTNERGCSKEVKKWWYLALLCEEYFAGGYLPTDERVLWKLADAQTEWFFREHCGEVLACFKRTPDGARMYHDRLLEVLEEAQQKSRPPTPPSSVCVSLEPGFYRSGQSQNPDGEGLFAEFRAAHPRATGSCAESTAFFDACHGDELEARRIIEAAQLYRQAAESGEMGHAPARAVNWLRDCVFNESPEFWRKGGKSDSRSERNRSAIESAIAEVADRAD